MSNAHDSVRQKIDTFVRELVGDSRNSPQRTRCPARTRYFILDILGAKLLKQSVDNTSGDRMEVQTNGEKSTYYFEISKAIEGYKRQGIN